jgi:hypothetical protein
MAQHLLKNRRSVTEFVFEKGCTLAENTSIIIGVYGLEGGHPCDRCACLPCGLLEQFKREDKAPKLNGVAAVTDLKTNTELATENGISKRQASQRRIPGTNQLNPAEV